jgi:hypothetical protein
VFFIVFFSIFDKYIFNCIPKEKFGLFAAIA